jgi:hypothetical protein
MRCCRDALTAIKWVHTLVWAFFASCIIVLPVASLRGDHLIAACLAGVVLVEVAVLALNRWHCPLTAVAARHTSDRSDNYDIYLPLWLARYNKVVFGGLYLIGLVIALYAWLSDGA